MFDMCSIIYSANVNAMLEFFPRTRQLWLIDVGYGLWNSFSKLLKGLLHQRLVYLFFHIISIGRSRMESSPGI
jgi:hypothetical protein